MKKTSLLCSMFIFMFTTFAYADISHHSTSLFVTKTKMNQVEAKSPKYSNLPKLAATYWITDKGKIGFTGLTFGNKYEGENGCNQGSLPNHCTEAVNSCERNGVRYYSSTCQTCSEGYEVERGICKPKDCSNYPSASDSITGCARTSECQSALQITYKCEECNAQGWESDGNGGCKPKTCDEDGFPYHNADPNWRPTICKTVSEPCYAGNDVYYGCTACNPGYIQDEGYCVETGGGSGGGSWEGCQLAEMPEIFDGKGNTQKIVAQMRNEALAAYACSKFYAPGVSASDPTFGQGQWYLPAMGELMEVYGYDPAQVAAGTGKTGATGTNKTLINNALTTLAGKGVDAAVLRNGYYWSSSEYSYNHSWTPSMNDGYRFYEDKSDLYYVRSFLLLENCFTPLTLSAPQVGDVMYADKSWGAASDYSGSKVAVGVITYVSPTSGYVVIMSLKDLAFSSTNTVGNFNPATPYTGSSATTIWSVTKTDITALTNYNSSSLLTAIQNDTRAECTGVSGGGSGGGNVPDHAVAFEVTVAARDSTYIDFVGGSITVDWGDGNTDNATSTDTIDEGGMPQGGDTINHTYTTAGTYAVYVTGTPTWVGTNTHVVTKLIDISLPSIVSYNETFIGATDMTGNLGTMTFPSGLKYADSMFSDCENLTGTIPALPSGLIIAADMFEKCSGLTGNIPALPNSITDGGYMFRGCSGLTGSIPTLPSGLTNGASMFADCSGLTGTIPALPSGLTDGYRMFSGCRGLSGQCPTKPDSLTAVTSMYANTDVCCDYGDATATNCSGGDSWEGCELAEMPEIFDGKGNTQKIVAQIGNEALAAYACTQFYAPGVSASDPTFGQGKWYLPAIGELMEVYGYNPARVTTGTGITGATGTNKTLINNALTTLAGKGVDAATLTNSPPYWSSPEFSSDRSWALGMASGGRSYYNKNGNLHVRSFLLLENAFNPSSASIPQVGDVMYADKSWGVASDYNGSKVAVGVITYVSPTSGYVTIMSLKDLAFSSSDTAGNFNPATPYTGSSATTIWSVTNTDITALTNYDSNGLKTAIKNSTRPECE